MFRSAPYKSTRRAHRTATTATTKTSVLRTNDAMPIMKCSSTHAPTSRISAATTVRPNDLDDESFTFMLSAYSDGRPWPAGKVAGPRKQPGRKALPLPGRIHRGEHRLREA